MSAQIEVLGPVHHACTRCGGSCQGTWVRVLAGEEEDRIRALGARLGVEDPVERGKLRMVEGQCAFLGADHLCRIHAEVGFAEKPRVCRQYPVVAVKVDDTVRVGIDPGCYTHVTTWEDGPSVEDVGVMPGEVLLQADQRMWEEAIVDLCGVDGLTLARLLEPLTGDPAPTDGGLQPGFASRLVERLGAVDLPAVIAGGQTARKLRMALGPIATASRGWDPAAPPAWPKLAPRDEAYAVDAVRRMVYLRLAPEIPTVAGVAVLTIAGAVAAAWATSHRDAFGVTFAGWCRAIRSQVFRDALFPNREAITWLARGSV